MTACIEEGTLEELLNVIKASRDFLHDMNNKMMIISGYSTQLMEDWEQRGEEFKVAVEKLKKIEKAVTSLQKIGEDHRSYLIQMQSSIEKKI